MEELRKGFHHDLANAREELARLAALVAELVPRATGVLLDGDLEGAELMIRGDAEQLRQVGGGLSATQLPKHGW